MRSHLGPVARGVAAGLVGGLLLLVLQAVARLLLGVSPPAELVGDRVAPLLTIDQFFGLFGLLGGYNQLKQAGILGGSAGQLTVGIAIAVAVALAARRSARRAWRLLAVLTAVLFLAAIAVLWPILGTNYAGFGPGSGRVITIATMAVTFGLLGATIGLVLRLIGAFVPAAASAELVPAGGGAPVSPPPATGASDGPPAVGRRAVLVGGVGVVGVGLAAATGALGATLYRRATFGYDGLRVGGPQVDPITPIEKFYTVTKNVSDPRVDVANWNFTVDGAVNTARTWDLAALQAMPQVTQETTLCCISNGVGDGLESNAMWTGVPLADLITAAGPSDQTVEVLLTAVDGYSDTFSIAKAMDPTTLLAFRMNGVELPMRHGFPARMVVPGMFGEKNLKWITKVELVTEERKGFYETQGWGPTFEVPNRSKFTGQAAGAQMRLQDTAVLSGTASGGNRGVSRVEVSVDGGSTWRDAQITYPGTMLSWALWSYDWKPTATGPAKLVVRMTDRTGQVQTAEERGVVPMGATGYHKIDVTVV
jgi:DMSO/TMAO reductase YedYZ molybdopterin-dependent catalytic subunit